MIKYNHPCHRFHNRHNPWGYTYIMSAFALDRNRFALSVDCFLFF
jgi:hypothetical protein